MTVPIRDAVNRYLSIDISTPDLTQILLAAHLQFVIKTLFLALEIQLN